MAVRLYDDVLSDLNKIAIDANDTTIAYKGVLTADENTDITLIDGTKTPSIDKRIKAKITSLTPDGTASGFKKVIRSLTANTTFSQRDSGTISHNLNAVGGLDVTLPKAEAGLFFEFRCLKAVNLTINTNASDSYYDTGLKTKLTNTVGAHLKIFAITDTQWFVETITGTWS